MSIAYSAVVLTDESRNKLIAEFRDRVPEGWEIIAHHMTLNMGPLPEALRASKGLPVKLQVSGWFMDDKVAALMAFPPQELSSFVRNSQPHITFAVNRAAGGKPVMSNAMIEKSLKQDDAEGVVGPMFTPVHLMGQIQEVESK